MKLTNLCFAKITCTIKISTKVAGVTFVLTLYASHYSRFLHNLHNNNDNDDDDDDDDDKSL